MAIAMQVQNVCSRERKSPFRTDVVTLSIKSPGYFFFMKKSFLFEMTDKIKFLIKTTKKYKLIEIGYTVCIYFAIKIMDGRILFILTANWNLKFNVSSHVRRNLKVLQRKAISTHTLSLSLTELGQRLLPLISL